MKMSKKNRDKLNLFKNFLLGGMIGFILSIVFYFLKRVTLNYDHVIDYSLYIQIAVILVFFLPTVFSIQKAKQQFSQMDESIDVDDDQHREKAEQMLFRALVFNRLCLVLGFVSMRVAFDFNNEYLLFTLLVFLV